MQLKQCLTLALFLSMTSFASSLAADKSSGDTASWKVYSNKPGEFELKYPATLSGSSPTGSYTVNGVKHEIEEFELRTLDQVNGKPTSVAMSFTTQRGINPKHLSIKEWYEALAKRQLQSDSESVTTVGGKAAVHRGPLAQAETVKFKDGKVTERHSGMVPANTTFVRLNDSDVLTVSIPDVSSQLGETYQKVLSTLKIKH